MLSVVTASRAKKVGSEGFAKVKVTPHAYENFTVARYAANSMLLLLLLLA